MFQTSLQKHSIPIQVLFQNNFQDWYSQQSEQTQRWVDTTGFTASASSLCMLPDRHGNLSEVLVGATGSSELRWALGDIGRQLPMGSYHLEGDWTDQQQEDIALGWALGLYCFKDDESAKYPMLYVKQAGHVLPQVDAITLVRDLINTPANRMMPEHLSQATQTIAQQFQATFSEVSDREQMRVEYPAIHAVGRASEHDPRMIRLHWGEEEHPHIVLVGKGICFDTGGLDIKGSKFMRNMKKDMGGAAHVLGLAMLVMSYRLPVQLTVLIAAADNAISGDAFRPGDVIGTRSGKTIEIDNTDAEGRLVLCDALTEACALEPDLVMDFATLTGAARVALGTEVPVFFTNNDGLASQLNAAGYSSHELIWQLPLYQDYFSKLSSNVADLVNSPGESYGGAITAALFLEAFISDDVPWVHFDVMAWNLRNRPGRAIGGEAMGLLAAFEYLRNTYR
ncbi:MAG: Peptidase B (EC [uncultured Thiotrichaceae bacterium]|uniref:Peptidase B (EC) n=1 Tax=uncultured Thiotrichaceae bacterium TaxID=298394 RepID=A0A6S6SRL6_9GAMM|nr:MAG: Peptidase B (EC [uncultured Thiotrichaceae bacterium]